MIVFLAIADLLNVHVLCITPSHTTTLHFIPMLFVVVQDGRAAMQQLQCVAEEFEKGKLEIATTADVRVEGECHFFIFALCV